MLLEAFFGLCLVIIICIYYNKKYNELAGIFPSIQCQKPYSKYYYLWVYMEHNGETLDSKQEYIDWAQDTLLLAGPNRIGIYFKDPVDNDTLDKYYEIYKKVFNYPPKYIRGPLTSTNKQWCLQHKMIVKNSTYKLKYC